MTTSLTLYHRYDCHLCEEFELALQAALAGKAIAVQCVDIDQDATTQARFNTAVPVLMAGEVEICRYWLESTKLNDWLTKIG